MAPRKKQQPRRKPGTGAIRRHKGRAHSYETAFKLRDGRTRYDSFATEADARAHLDRLTAERDSVINPRNIAGGSQRVETFLIAWLNMKAIRIKPTTLADYTYQCRLANERIGGHRVDEVSREIADDLIAYYYRRGYQNVGQLLAVLKQAFKYAERAGHILRNPFADITAPRVTRRETLALTEAQRGRMLITAEGDPYCALWHLYGRLALRRGEAIALRWVDVDEEGATLTIKHNRTRVGAVVHTGTPKTPRSVRLVPVPADVLTMLQEIKRAQIRAGVFPVYVFADEAGAPLKPARLDTLWKQLRARAGLPEQVTIHGLRHTALTLLEKAHTPPSIVQALAGHSSATMTRHYTDHTTVEDLRRAIGG
jgi:integrase